MGVMLSDVWSGWLGVDLVLHGGDKPQVQNEGFFGGIDVDSLVILKEKKPTSMGKCVPCCLRKEIIFFTTEGQGAQIPVVGLHPSPGKQLSPWGLFFGHTFSRGILPGGGTLFSLAGLSGGRVLQRRDQQQQRGQFWLLLDPCSEWAPPGVWSFCPCEAVVFGIWRYNVF